MAKWISRNVRFILILSIALTVTNCSDPKRTQSVYIPAEKGGQDTGGGFVAYSTSEEVNAALDKALELATEPRADKNIYAQFWKYFGRTLKPEFIKTPRHIFPKISGPTDGAIDLDAKSEIYSSPVLAAFKSNKIDRLKSGNCLKSDVLSHNDASVSSFTVNADICISIGNLTRIPRKSLLREILGLLLHEASHMGGADELEAREWQSAFTNYFEERFGEIEYDSVGSDTRRVLRNSKSRVSEIKILALKNPNDPRVFSQMGEVLDQLADLPYYSDTLALELKTNPLRPDLINNYSYSALVLMQKIKVRFIIKSDFLRVKGMGIPLDFMPSDKEVSSLDEIAEDLLVVEQNFFAFVAGSPAARSKCVKPDDAGDLNDFPVNPPDGKKPDMIQRRCDDDF